MTSEEFARRIVDMTQSLYRVSYAMLSQPSDREDAVQECLRKAWQMRSRLREERYMKTWVTRILINECRNIQRRYRREIPTEPLPERAAPPERVAPPDADRELHDAILRLDEKHRVPIVLHYLEGYSVKEIARMLKLPTGTVKSRMTSARETLKKTLSEEATEL